MDGHTLDGNSGVSIAVKDKKQNILVIVSKNGYSTTYTLTVEQGASTIASFEMLDEGTQFRLNNENGEELVSREEVNDAGNTVYFYTVVSGQTYTYFATLDTCYHAEKTFTANAASNIFTVKVLSGSDAPQLKELFFGTQELWRAHGDLPVPSLSFRGVRLDRNKQTVITVQTIILRLLFPVCNSVVSFGRLIFFAMTAKHPFIPFYHSVSCSCSCGKTYSGFRILLPVGGCFFIRFGVFSLKGRPAEKAPQHFQRLQGHPQEE